MGTYISQQEICGSIQSDLESHKTCKMQGAFLERNTVLVDFECQFVTNRTSWMPCYVFWNSVVMLNMTISEIYMTEINSTQRLILFAAFSRAHARQFHP